MRLRRVTVATYLTVPTADLSELKGLQIFYKDQIEAAEVLNQELVEDGRALVDLLSDIAGEHSALIKNSATGLAPAGLKRAA